MWNYNANDQLTSASYDGNGNTIASGGLSYAYDFENPLVQKGGLTIVYDGDGNRIAKPRQTAPRNSKSSENSWWRRLLRALLEVMEAMCLQPKGALISLK